MGRRFWVVEVGFGWFVSNWWFEEGDRFRGRKCLLVCGYGGSLDAMRCDALQLVCRGSNQGGAGRDGRPS